MPRRARFAVLGFVLCLLGVPRAQQPSPPSQLPDAPSYDELKQLIAGSTLKYEMVADKNVAATGVPNAPVLPPGLVVVENGASRGVTRPKPPADDVQKAFDRCEAIYSQQDFKAAAACYEQVRKLDPTYTLALTDMGDCFFRLKDFERAKECLTKAVEENPGDYQSRWFLGDALWAGGDVQGAVEQITIAHLFNVNHPKLKEVLIARRDRTGRPWRAWELRPRFAIERHGDRVIVRHAPEWKGYALVKAVWKHEPGFAEKYGGPDYAKQPICVPEERRALEGYVAESPTGSIIADAVKDGFTTEMIFYEMLLPRAPVTMLLLPKPVQQRIALYVSRYH